MFKILSHLGQGYSSLFKEKSEWGRTMRGCSDANMYFPTGSVIL